jgi:hypothetical protein
LRLFSGWPTRYHERSAERSLNSVSSVATRIILESSWPPMAARTSFTPRMAIGNWPAKSSPFSRPRLCQRPFCLRRSGCHFSPKWDPGGFGSNLLIHLKDSSIHGDLIYIRRGPDPLPENWTVQSREGRSCARRSQWSPSRRKIEHDTSDQSFVCHSVGGGLGIRPPRSSWRWL